MTRTTHPNSAGETTVDPSPATLGEVHVETRHGCGVKPDEPGPQSLPATIVERPSLDRIARVVPGRSPFRIPLKTRYYARLLWHNPWLLTCNEKVRNYIRYKMTPRRVVVDTRKTAPVYCSVNVTQRCNLSCSFCIVGDWINEPSWRKNEATVSQMDRLLDHPVIRRCLYIMLVGGEPLINRNIAEIVRRTKSRRHLVGMTSNGTLLADRLEELRSAGLDLINISLYEENKDALADILPIATKRLHCKLIKVIGRRQLETPGLIEECVRFARETGCGQIYFQNMLSPPANSKTARKAETRKRKQLLAAAQAERSSTVAPPDDASSPTSLRVLADTVVNDTEPIYDDHEAYPSIQEEMARKYPDVRISWPAPVARIARRDRKRCRMPWYLLITDIQGNQGFCCKQATCSGPNLYEVPPADVYNTPEWIQTRKALLSTDTDAPAKCEGCFMLDDAWCSEM
ncbi:MAG: radical SAM protein [Phycisphaerae bacterium]